MRVYDVVYGRRYTTASGEEKTQWFNCGAVIKTKNGLSLKLDLIPVGAGKDGLWFGLFEPKQADESRARPARVANSDVAPDIGGEEIPF